MAAELDAVGRSLMLPTDDIARLAMWFSVRSARFDFGAGARSVRVSTDPGTFGVRSYRKTGSSGFRASLNQAERDEGGVALAGRGHRGARVDVLPREVAPIALMAGDVEELRRFVQRCVGRSRC